MAIVVDINSLPAVFSESDARYSEFMHVKEWVTNGRGVLVFGGTHYKNELAKLPRYFALIRKLRDGGRAVGISDRAVDALENEVKASLMDSRCDDPHIIALLGASRCPLLCSVDARSYQYIKKRSLYPKGSPKVKIYSGSRNVSVLKDCRGLILTNVE